MKPRVRPDDVYNYMNKLGKTEKGVKFLWLVLLGLDLTILEWMADAVPAAMQHKRGNPHNPG